MNSLMSVLMDQNTDPTTKNELLNYVARTKAEQLNREMNHGGYTGSSNPGPWTNMVNVIAERTSPEFYANQFNSLARTMRTLPEELTSFPQPQKLENVPYNTRSIAEAMADPKNETVVNALNAFGPQNLGGFAGITAFHGSPHKFDKFRMDKIGTGEGAQAYGHGLYFAENPGVAKSYQQALSSNSILIDGKPIQNLKPRQNYSAFKKSVSALNLTDEEAREASSLINSYMTLGGDWNRVRKQVEGYTDYFRPKVMAVLDKIEPRISHKFRGNLYKVDIADDAVKNFLDWDKPLSQQPESVRKALSVAKETNSDVPWVAYFNGKSVNGFRTRKEAMDWIQNAKGGDLVNSLENLGAPAQREAFNSLGVRGIRYLDQGSRQGGKGTSNFVVFDEDLVKILSRE